MENTRASFVGLDVYLASVPTEHLDTIDERIKASLTRIASEPFDMDRMRNVIRREKLKVRLCVHGPTACAESTIHATAV